MFDRYPLLRLLGLSLIVLALGAGASLMLRWMGAQQQFLAVDHPWMKEAAWRVARLAPDHCDAAGLDDLLALDANWVVWIDLQPTAENGFKIVCPAKPFEMGPASDGPLLKAIVEKLAAKPVIFNVRALDPGSAGRFLDELTGFTDKKRDVGIASPSQSLLRTLRKRRPDWLYAADASTWAKLKIFSTIGIESAADLWPDFFVASSEKQDPGFFSLAAAKEISRRKKVILLEWDGTTPIPEPWKENLRGILTYRPKKFSPDIFFPEKGAK